MVVGNLYAQVAHKWHWCFTTVKKHEKCCNRIKCLVQLPITIINTFLTYTTYIITITFST